MYRLKTLLIFFVIVGLGACDILEQEPQQSLPVAGGLDSVNELQKALTGAYNDLQEWPGGDSFAQTLYAGDMMSDNTTWTGSFPTYTEMAEHAMTSQNGSIEVQWNGAYEAINTANIILEKLNELENPNADQATIDDIRGQALFIRALEYFYLVQYFAKPWGATSDNSHMGVPLQLEAVTSSDDFSNPSRASVSKVYNQILTDLQNAEGLISNTAPNRATAGAATALRARIALIQGRWSDAASLANQVIPNYSLLPDVTTFFRNEGSAESIFEIQNTVQDNPGVNNTSITALYNVNSRDEIQISNEYQEAINSIITADQETELQALGQSATDTRVSKLLTGTDSPDDVDQAGAASNTTKYESIPNEEDNLPILRLPEMILTRAEALAENASNLAAVPEEAIELLNRIRTRAIVVTDANGNPVSDESAIEYERSDFADKQEFIDAILLERRVELAFEGLRLIDLKRKQKSINGDAWDANNIVFPIPQSQIDANDNITQNPGYEEGG